MTKYLKKADGVDGYYGDDIPADEQPTQSIEPKKCRRCYYGIEGICTKCGHDSAQTTGLEPNHLRDATKVIAHDTDSSKCVFCQKIVNGDYPERVDDVVFFEPLNPVTPGHKLAVPIHHVEHFSQDAATSAATMKAAALYAFNKGDMNIITSKGRSATQTVKHLHLHLVPRSLNDGLMLPWTAQQSDPVQAELSDPTIDELLELIQHRHSPLIDFHKDRLRSAVSRQVEAARRDELAKANTWSLSANLSNASKHKWANYHSDRINALKGGGK